MNKKFIWLFNFSSSWVGGGLIRTIETVKWFDNNMGAYFIINDQIKNKISKYNKNNKYFFVSDNKTKRLFSDGYYIPKIIGEIGKPDIYFSYGIPVFKDIGKINWFHLSNALALKTDKISLPLKTRLQMLILKKRIIKSIKYTHIATGESEFSVNLLKEHVNKRNLKCHYDLLPNGYDINTLKEIVNKKRKVLSKYAVTIGTYKYKRIKVALELFHQIKEASNLKKFIIVGQTNNLSKSVINDRLVEIWPSLSREDLLYLLYNAEYYISASQIENSSNAVLEALLLSKNIILSDIPSHNEMLRNFKTKKMILNNLKFNALENINNDKIDAISWIEVSKKLFDIINDFKQSDYSS
ncbi:glycosyltransferase [Flavobacteriaceae bacterium]|jgi:glycosyltransferase involved in cell wall biosynthesis|nr:glycosyltransferase [Flavobacteriaceae bacterium]